MARTEEVREEKASEEQEESMVLFGLIEYKKAIISAVVILVLAVGYVYFAYDEEDRQPFLTMAAFNLSSIGVTMLMRRQL